MTYLFESLSQNRNVFWLPYTLLSLPKIWSAKVSKRIVWNLLRKEKMMNLFIVKLRCFILNLNSFNFFLISFTNVRWAHAVNENILFKYIISIQSHTLVSVQEDLNYIRGSQPFVTPVPPNQYWALSRTPILKLTPLAYPKKTFCLPFVVFW